MESFSHDLTVEPQSENGGRGQGEGAKEGQPAAIPACVHACRSNAALIMRHTRLLCSKRSCGSDIYRLDGLFGDESDVGGNHGRRGTRGGDDKTSTNGLQIARG
jgi:hypothetical protein